MHLSGQLYDPRSTTRVQSKDKETISSVVKTLAILFPLTNTREDHIFHPMQRGVQTLILSLSASGTATRTDRALSPPTSCDGLASENEIFLVHLSRTQASRTYRIHVRATGCHESSWFIRIQRRKIATFEIADGKVFACHDLLAPTEAGRAGIFPRPGCLGHAQASARSVLSLPRIERRTDESVRS